MEMVYRRNLGYPPFSHRAAIYLSHRFKDKLSQSCSDMTLLLDQIKCKNNLEVEIWGPTPLVIEKRAGQFTWCYQIRSEISKDLHQLFFGMEHFYNIPSGVSLKLDIDPYHVL